MEDIRSLDKEILKFLAHDEDESETTKMLMKSDIKDPEAKEMVIQLNSVANKRNRMLLTYLSRISKAIIEQSGDYERMEEYMEEKVNININNTNNNGSSTPKSRFSPTTNWIIGSVVTVVGLFILLFFFTWLSPDTTKRAIEHTKDLVLILKDGSSHAKELGSNEPKPTQGGQQ